MSEQTKPSFEDDDPSFCVPSATGDGWTAPLRLPVVPRRNRVDKWTEAEHAIDAAVQAVERAGADVRLTDAVNLLWWARICVADFVDGVKDARRFVKEEPYV